MAQSYADGGDGLPMQEYRDALARGNFRIQQCKDCGRHGFPPRLLCIHCGASDLKWVEPGGRATVVALAGREAGEGAEHVIALVELEEGPRLRAPVMGLAPGKVHVGMHVSAHIGIVAGERALVFYGLEQGSNEW